MVLATAHPAKFPEAIEAVLGFVPPLPAIAEPPTDGVERLSVIAADLGEALATVRAFQGAAA